MKPASLMQDCAVSNTRLTDAEGMNYTGRWLSLYSAAGGSEVSAGITDITSALRTKTSLPAQVLLRNFLSLKTFSEEVH